MKEEGVGSQEPGVRGEAAEKWKPHFPWIPQQPPPSTQQPAPALLDLSAPERIVKLRSGEHRYIHIFNPPTADDWLQFEQRARPTQIFRGEEVETHTGLREAALALWEKRIKRVEGYGDSGLRIQDSSLSTEHRIQAVLGLDRVEINAESAVEGATEDTETKVVVLQAWWNGQLFPTLIHRFKRPLVEHELRFSEATARSSIVLPRGVKRAKDAAIESRKLPSLPTLVALYDELVVGMEGYAAGQSPIGNRQSAIEMMDVPHKSAAVRGLFAVEAVSLDEE